MKRLPVFAKGEVLSQDTEGSTVGLAREECLEGWILAGCPELIVIGLVLLCVDLTVCTLWSDGVSVSSVFMVTRLVTGELSQERTTRAGEIT